MDMKMPKKIKHSNPNKDASEHGDPMVYSVPIKFYNLPYENIMKKTVLIASILIGTLASTAWAEPTKRQVGSTEQTNKMNHHDLQKMNADMRQVHESGLCHAKDAKYAFEKETKDVLSESKPDVFASPKADVFSKSKPDVFASPKADVFAESKPDVFASPKVDTFNK